LSFESPNHFRGSHHDTTLFFVRTLGYRHAPKARQAMEECSRCKSVKSEKSFGMDRSTPGKSVRVCSACRKNASRTHKVKMDETPPPVQPIPAVKLSKPRSEKTRGFCGDAATCGKLNCTRSHTNGKDWLVTDRTLWGLFDRMKCKTSDCRGALKCVDVTGSWCSNGVMRFRCVTGEMGRR